MVNKNICLLTTTLPIDEKIADVWNKFDEELQKYNYKLCLLTTGMHPLCTCDYIEIPFLLDQFADLNISSNVARHEKLEINSIDLILREKEWFQMNEDDFHHHTLGYSNCGSFYEEIINSLKPSVILAWQNSLPQTNILKQLASEYSIPHFILERGMLTDTFMIERDGNVALSELINNYSLNKIIKEYSTITNYELIKDYYLSQRPTKYNQLSENDSLDVLEQFGFDEKPLIIYFLQIDSAVGMYPANNYLSRKASPIYKNTAETISELVKVVDQLELNLIVKQHPRDYNKYESLNSDCVKIVKDINYRILMEKAEVMIYSGSTLQFEGLLFEKPVVLLTKSELSGNGVAYEVESKSDLLDQIKSALNREGYIEKNERGKAFINWIANYFLFGYSDEIPVQNTLGDLAEHCHWTGVKIENLTLNEKWNRLITVLDRIDFKNSYRYDDESYNLNNSVEVNTISYKIPDESYEVKILLNRAEELISQNRFEEAEKILNEILVVHKNNIDVLNNFSVIEILRKNYLTAVKYIRLVLEHDYQNEIALENYRYIFENKNMRKEKTRDCDSISTVENDKKYSDDMSMKKAEELIEKNELDEATEELQRIIKNEPEHIAALINMVVILIMKEDYDESLKILQHVLILDPLNEIAIENITYLNQLLEQKKNHPNNTIDSKNEWAEGNHLEPDIKYGRKLLEATKNALSSVDKDKKNSVQQRRISMKTMSEPSDKVENNNRRVDEIIDTIGNGNNLMAIMELAEVDELREKSNWSIKKSASMLLDAEKLIEENKLDKALEKLVSILSMEPKHIEALNDYALVMILMEDYDEALRILQHILKLNPNNGVAKDNYAYLLENNFVSQTNMNSLNEKSDYEKKIDQELKIYENQKVVHNLPPNHDIYTSKVLSPKLKEATNYDNFWDWCAGEIDSLTSNLSRKIYGISIGCGNGDSEIEILKRVKNKHLIEFVGIDINPTMVDRGKKLAKENNLDCLDFQVGDFNYLKLDRKYDFFFANHSLHHVVELENLFDTIDDHSTDEMVFMINDMVGRNGHVLWDGSKKVVDHIWNQLNPKYKFNAYTKQYDREVMNHDCSVEGFEGIRAEDILPELLKRFDFDVYLPFSLIVNRFIDRVYGHNFDLGNEVDLTIIHEIINLDQKLLADRGLSATQALFKLKKKGMTKEPRLIYQTAEESVSLRTNILEKENSSLDLLEYRKTIDDLKMILKEDENNIEALNNLSTEYIIIGKYEEASTLVSKVLHLKNNNKYGLRNYQYLKQVLGGSIKLKPMQQIVIEDEVEKINTMAQVAVDNSKLFEARRLINKSLMLDPNNAITQLIIEQIEIRKEMLHNTNAWDSKKCNDAITKAEKFIEEEKIVEAENMLLSILEAEPENIYALNNFSVVKIIQKEYLVAGEIIDFVLQLDPLNEIANGNCDYIAELSENLITVEYGDGFYEKEKNWYWIDKMAHFNINNSKKEQTICFDITCSDEKNYNIFPFNVFIYVGDSGVYSMSFESSNQTIPVEFESIGSDFKIMIESDDAFIPSAQGVSTDSRRVAMRLSNLHAKNEDNIKLEIVEADSNINSGHDAVSRSSYTLLGDAKYPEYSDALENFLKDPTIMIELNSKCNFYCSYCRSEDSSRQKSFMKPELFRHLLPQLKDMTTQPLRFHVDGEPTLHPQFLELALEANKAGHKISLATNGSNLKKEFLQIDMSPLINISCSAEELKQRSSINFNKYVAKIEQYIKDWNEVDNVQHISLKIYTSGLERANRNIIESKKIFASEFVNRLNFAGKSSWEGDENYQKFEYRKDEGNIFTLSFQPLTEGGLYPNISNYGFGGKELSLDRGFCDSAWKTLSVLSDGSVCFCCVDVTGETYYTKPEEIWSSSLKEIWLDHPRIKRLRKELLSGKISLPICRQCLETSSHREQYIFKEIFHFEKNSLST
jgi:tetratricopeptide (TPR) repeat protein/organic radical activating enzyme